MKPVSREANVPTASTAVASSVDCGRLLPPSARAGSPTGLGPGAGAVFRSGPPATPPDEPSPLEVMRTRGVGRPDRESTAATLDDVAPGRELIRTGPAASGRRGLTGSLAAGVPLAGQSPAPVGVRARGRAVVARHPAASARPTDHGAGGQRWHPDRRACRGRRGRGRSRRLDVTTPRPGRRTLRTGPPGHACPAPGRGPVSLPVRPPRGVPADSDQLAPPLPSTP